MSSRGIRPASELRGDEATELGSDVAEMLNGSSCGVFAADESTEGLRTRFARRKVKKAVIHGS